MKKFILSLLITLITSCTTQAKDVLPIRLTENNVNTVGMYQVGDDITIYKEPDEKSQILYLRDLLQWVYQARSSTHRLRAFADANPLAGAEIRCFQDSRLLLPNMPQ